MLAIMFPKPLVIVTAISSMGSLANAPAIYDASSKTINGCIFSFVVPRMINKTEIASTVINQTESVIQAILESDKIGFVFNKMDWNTCNKSL
jgi:hypothetical protein